MVGINIDDAKLTKLVNIFENATGNGIYPRIDKNSNDFPTYGQMVTSGYRVFLSLSNDQFASKYNNIQYGGIFENTYADSPNVTEMIQFNDKQVAKFNNNQ